MQDLVQILISKLIVDLISMAVRISWRSVEVNQSSKQVYEVFTEVDYRLGTLTTIILSHTPTPNFL